MTAGLAAESPAPIPSSEIPRGMMGTMLFIGSELFVFGALFVSYFFIRVAQTSQHGSWEGVFGRHLPVGEALVNTAVLVASSGTAVLAQRIRPNRKRLALTALGITILLGACFLAIQVKEFLDIAHVEHAGPQTSAYASVFYTLTSIHGLHVAVGVLLLCAMWVRTLRGTRTAADVAAYRAATLYWHFVDVMWLIIVASVYLPDNVSRLF